MRKREPLWLSFPIKQAQRRLRRMQQAVFKAAPRLAYTNVAAEWPAQHRHDRGACNRSLLTCCLCRSSLPGSLPGIPRMATAIRRNPASPLDLTRFAPVEAAGSSLARGISKRNTIPICGVLTWALGDTPHLHSGPQIKINCTKEDGMALPYRPLTICGFGEITRPRPVPWRRR